MSVLTAAVLLAGVGLLGAGLLTGGPTWLPGLLVLALAAAVSLLWRPTEFLVERGVLRTKYPLRQKSYSLADLVAVGPLDRAGFVARFRYGLRVGVGGLFGGFGWLWTARGWVEMDIARTTGMVLLEWRDRPPLLVTPARPDEFVEALKEAAGLT